jgi:RNA polymerase sigma factor for flagellar operon FliA
VSSPTTKDPPEVLARIREGMDLVDLVARQMRRSVGARLSVDDLASYGHEGLIRAARTFKEDLGVPFRRWANLRIRGAMLDGMRSQGDLPRHVHRRIAALEAGDTMHDALLEEDAAAPATSAQEADKRLGAYLRGIATAMAIGVLGDARGGEVDQIADRSPSPDEALERERLSRAVAEILATRPHEEQTLIRRHYFEGATFDSAAKELGLSKSWASRLHARAIDAIATALKRQSK